MTSGHDDELEALLRAADPVSGWEPDSGQALHRLQAAHPELATATNDAEPVRRPDVLAVTIDDLTVEYRTPPTQLRRRRPQWMLAAAAAVVLLLAVSLTVAALATGRPSSTSRLKTLTPAQTPQLQSPSPFPTATPFFIPPVPHSSHPATRATVPQASPATTRPVALPPAAPLAVHVSVSATTIPFGGSITVTYSWTDGDGALLNINHVESTALTITRPRCMSRELARHPHSGHGSYVFSLNNPGFVAGLHFPFDHPERIRVGVEITTGGGCAVWEDKTAAQWVTVLPPPAPSASPVPTSTP